MAPSADRAPLAAVRVVEWGERISAPYAGLLLASLGADVVKLEPPSGDRLRRHGPLLPRRATGRSPERGALFLALNAGKRSVLEDADDPVAHLDRLLPGADLLLTNLTPAQRAARGVDLKALARAHPELVVVSVQPFGESGPIGGAPGDALTAAAAGGATIAVGSPDRHPLPLPFELADYEAGANAAAAAVAGLLAGRGQLIEVATADVIASYVFANAQMYAPYEKPWMRNGRSASGSGGAYPYGLFPCADGAVAIIGRTAADWRKLVTMMGSPAWAEDPRFADPFEIAAHHAAEADRHLDEWLATRTRAELIELARESGFALGPVLSVAEAAAYPPFRARGVFPRRPGLGDSFTPPRLPWEAELSPEPWARAGAPRLGAGPEPAWDVRPARPDPPPAPLAGVRVLDFGWVWSAPMVGAVLADLGADVIKVEHRARLDNARLRGRPLSDGKPVPGPAEEVSFYFRQNNRGKRSIGVDLKHPQGREVIRGLAARSDVLLENLTRGAFERAGLDLDELVRSNPGLIVASMSAAGREGPLSDLRVYAPLMTGLTGVESLVGYRGEPSLGMVNLAIGDPNAASHTLVALLAVLLRRRGDGRGGRLELAQIEAMLPPLFEAFAEVQVAGRDPRVAAMDPAHCCPYGHFPCAGEDRWVALVIDSEAAWEELADLLGGELAGERFAGHRRRGADRDALDRAIAERTAAWPREDLVEELRARGVAAAPVQTLAEVIDDEQLRARGLFAPLEHPVTGAHVVARVPWTLPATPAGPRRPAPLVGQHTGEVLGEVLGLDATQIEALRRAGAID
jgi:crotonobetainyl-CoA:carnitine CoA-transferase CaiB-like acyl-CoA transferase